MRKKQLRQSIKSKLIEFKVIKGVYLIGSGQEKDDFEFKIFRGHPDFDKIKEDSVCLTFFQTQKAITSILTLIRVEKVFENNKIIQNRKKLEYQQGYTLVPIIAVIENFDIRLPEFILATYERLVSESKQLSKTSMDIKTKIPPVESRNKFALYKEIRELHKQGFSKNKIAKIKGISRNTVYKYLNIPSTDFF